MKEREKPLGFEAPVCLKSFSGEFRFFHVNQETIIFKSAVREKGSLSFLEGTNKRELTKSKTPSFLPNKNSSCLSKYCGWFRNLANQLRLVVYPIIYTEFYTSQVVV